MTAVVLVPKVSGIPQARRYAGGAEYMHLRSGRRSAQTSPDTALRDPLNGGKPRGSRASSPEQGAKSDDESPPATAGAK